MNMHRISAIFCTVAVAAGGALFAQGTTTTTTGQTQQQPAASAAGEGRQGGRGQGRGRGFGPQGAVTIADGQECPPGTTEFRHLQCAPPASPPPTILDYRPRST